MPDYAKATATGFTKPHQVVDGAIICACLDPAAPLGRLAVDVAKRLPGALVDCEPLNYGSAVGMCSIYPDGRRRAIRFPAAELDTVDPAQLATMIEIA